MKKGKKNTYNICIVSDNFYPNMGGVELHMLSLSIGLIKRGHKVIIITTMYKYERQGIRYMPYGLKVYHVPFLPLVGQISFPACNIFSPLIRHILIRENIQIVHGHLAFSVLSQNVLLIATTLGLKTVYTVHSLFGFGDLAVIHINKCLRSTIRCVNHVITVSHISKENFFLRVKIPPDRISVIPNAIDTKMFYPEHGIAPDYNKRINVIILCRLAYRKGIDLIVDIIPKLCRMFPNIYFIIGGDGVMRISLEEMRENYNLYSRVEMLGSIKHSNVRKTLVRGHIYLNCSFTEAFCMAIVEAMSCGLYVISTKVGGIPEVFPNEMISLSKPNTIDLIKAFRIVLSKLTTIDPIQIHKKVKKMYDWRIVCERTELVYDKIIKDKHISLYNRIINYYRAEKGLARILFIYLIVWEHIFMKIMEKLCPAKLIEKAYDCRKIYIIK